MPEKFTVIPGAKKSETLKQSILQPVIAKITAAISPFSQFEGLNPDMVMLATYQDFTDGELAYEAERLSTALKDPSVNLESFLNQAVALRAVIELRGAKD